MVVGYEKSSKLTNGDFAFAGALSGFITRALCQPFDVLKIRFQLQVEPISPSSISKYRSLVQALAVIYREEGLKSYWKGHGPAQLLSVTYGSVQFCCFELFSKKANDLGIDKNHKPTLNFFCGAGAGAAATLVSFPFDVIRTRLIAQSELHKFYSGLLNSLRHICLNEGILVLFRGLTPTIIQVAPHAGVQFMTYKIFNGMYKNFIKIEQNNYSFIGSAMSGSLAGFCAKSVVYPFDLTRKRMQIQGFQANRDCFGRTFICKGMLDCIRRIYEVEGFSGFFKGLTPSLIKAVLASALHFSTYEFICKIIESRH